MIAFKRLLDGRAPLAEPAEAITKRVPTSIFNEPADVIGIVFEPAMIETPDCTWSITPYLPP